MIEDYNPWWSSGERIEEMEVYRKYSQSEVKWAPDVLDKVSLTPYSLNFIFGPRQVGKSTALILLVKRLLERKVNPKAIFYYSCDKLVDHRELDQLLGDLLKVKRLNNVSSAFILLDEVTYPREWYRAVKERIDRGDFRNDVLIMTGSLSFSAKREIETFPGRRGDGRVLLMLPLPFSRYVRSFKIDLPQGDLDFVLGEYPRYHHFIPRLNELLEGYLATGGFPNAIRDYVRTGRVGESTLSDFLSAVISDVNKLRRSETFFKFTVRGIVERTASEFSYHTLSKSFGVGTVKTAISYVELLQKMYLLKVLEQVDLNGDLLPRKERKFYFTDPLVYRAFSYWTSVNPPEESKLVEGVVVNHLSRVYETFYTKVRGEVDVVVRRGEELLGFEVKFGRVRWERKVLGRMKRITLLSKEEVDENVIPVSLFLSMFDVPQTVELKVMT